MIRPELIPLAIEAAIHAGHAILEVYQSDFTVEKKEDKSPLTLADKKAHEIIDARLAPTSIPLLSEEGRMIPYDERKKWKELWIVDPLDGTKEFIKRNGEFTVNIALVQNEYTVFGVIYQPVTGSLYYGVTSDAAYGVNYKTGGSIPDIIQKAEKLSRKNLPDVFTVVASRSHLSPETAAYIDEAKKVHGNVHMISSGSSLKLCMVASGLAHVYPRFAPTMEWDTAAGHAIVKAAGGNVYSHGTGEELKYNKPDLTNDWFIAK
jgi:3'(2'), 5'-bisphosphate nucleotidase